MGGKRRRDDDDVQSTAALGKKQRLHHLLEGRKRLPIWPRAQEIQHHLSTNHALVLTGETGSGKSTQVPQFLLDSAWCTGKIAVTQPRRVAAVNLARRVAEEMGSALGKASPGSTVGYSVRFDDNTSKGTRIKYLTEGMLLQEMLRDPKLEEYSCVIVDEVHERSVEVDLLLAFLRQLLEPGKRTKPLKVVVMSATADVESLMRFFANEHGGGPGSHGDSAPPASAVATTANESRARSGVARCHVQGRQYPVKTHYLDRFTTDYIDAARERILRIHCKEPMPGDILVFLDGAEAINSLQQSLDALARDLPAEVPRLLVRPLYAKLPPQAQQLVFERAPPHTRKVILSTNIAETSVTVPGVRFVVDSGRFKMKQFRPKLGLESLLAKPISQSSAEQRKGRAGREGPGQCYRLFTEHFYHTLPADTAPGILHCDLRHTVLVLKARGVDDLLAFPFLTAPPLDALQRALTQLVDLRCLDPHTGHLTPVGRQVARLPLPPPLGVVLLEAARPERACLAEVIDIIACLAGEDIWQPLARDADADADADAALDARARLHRRHSDHLTLLAAVQGYRAEAGDRKAWCRAHAVSHRAMRHALDIRRQLRQLALGLGLARTLADSDAVSDDAAADSVVKCFLVGFRANVAVLMPDRSYQTVARQTVAVHPSSVLAPRDRAARGVEGLVFCDFVYTHKAYAKWVSAIRLAWLDEVL